MGSDRRYLTWGEVTERAHSVATSWYAQDVVGVWGVPRGGIVPAVLVGAALGVPVLDTLPPPADATRILVVDDLVDSGATQRRYLADGYLFTALYHKNTGGDWLVFPWERDTDDANGPADAVVRLLQHIGEDPTREGLVDTPKRVLKALTEMTGGYDDDPAVVLGTTFDVAYDELVAVTGIEFVSMCEHHMLPFVGTAAVGYLPSDRVVGLSKLARIVDTYARRLQVQERMTNQIAEAIHTVLHPLGVAVVVRAEHSCMSCRGVRKRSAMVTSAMHGRFRDNAELRNEFLMLARGQ